MPISMSEVLPWNPMIRPATVADLGAIRDIYNFYVANSTCTYQIEPETEAERLAWFRERSPAHAAAPVNTARLLVPLEAKRLPAQ